MNGNDYIVAIIPARGGSKGVPGKNIRPLHGKPVIAYTIEAARNCPRLARVVVSTDSTEIAEISRKSGAEVPFMRPAELATDLSHTPAALRHAVLELEKAGREVDVVVTLQPTSPLRTGDDISRCIDVLYKGGFDSVVSARESDYPPYWTVRIADNRLVPVFEDGVRRYFQLERQELPRTYRLNGAVYVTRRRFLMEDEMLVVPTNCGVVEMGHRESLDIDTLEGFERIEGLVKKAAASAGAIA